jgi:hypothetical protein
MRESKAMPDFFKEPPTFSHSHSKIDGDGSIPAELVFLASAVTPESSTPCYPISALALALRLLSSEPHRFRQ